MNALRLPSERSEDPSDTTAKLARELADIKKRNEAEATEQAEKQAAWGAVQRSVQREMEGARRQSDLPFCAPLSLP